MFELQTESRSLALHRTQATPNPAVSFVPAPDAISLDPGYAMQETTQFSHFYLGAI
jgi:hypothetical protein